MDGSLSGISKPWLEKIKAAAKVKKEQFGDQAEECLKFYSGPYADWLYKTNGSGPGAYMKAKGNDDSLQAPTFQVTINKAAEVVSLFGPMLYPRNPERTVTPRKVYVPPPEYWETKPNPQVVMAVVGEILKKSTLEDKIRGELFDMILNWTPQENDLQTDSRLVIDEALIMGLGCWINEIKVLPDGTRIVGSFYQPVRSVFVDPDAVVWKDDIQWMCIECTHPVWQVEDEYGLARGSIKANRTSPTAAQLGQADGTNPNKQGMTNDLLTYYKIWSKMGIGGRMKQDAGTPVDADQTKLQDMVFGDFCFVVVCDACDYPLNLGPDLIARGNPDEIKKSVEWPIPFYIDGGWPLEFLEFHRQPNKLWPVSHLQPALGELQFINWVYSFLANKVAVASRDILVILKGLAEEAKDAIRHGPNYSVVEIDMMNQQIKTIDQIVKFIQHPPFNKEIYEVVDRMMELFDKRTGLTELMYGATTAQFRSAAEANIKKDQVSIRPQDMAQIVEERGSALARKEMASARWLLEAEDVKPCLGPIGALLWEQLVMTSDPRTLFHQYECRVESGSGRRPDKDRNAQNMKDAMQYLLQPLFTYSQGTLDFQPFNALVGAWAKSVDMDPSGLQLKAQPMLPPAPPGGPGGQPQPAAQGPPPNGP